MPSDLALHFMRMRPDFSSRLDHSRTSTTSPSFIFRVVSFSLRVASLALPPSSSKDSVRMVSFTTLKRLPPSSRKTVPWLPSMVIQPWSSSFIAMARTRSTPTVSSFRGPSKISTTSPFSSLRRVLLSLIVLVSVITVSWETFMKVRMRFVNLSLLMEPSSSSSSELKTLEISSSVGPASAGSSVSSGSALASSLAPSSSLAASSSAPSAFLALAFTFLGGTSHFLTNATNSLSSILSSLAILAKTSSPDSLLDCWWCLIMASTFFSRAYSSSASFFLESSRKRWARLVARVSRTSKRAILISSFFCSPIIQTCRSTSTPSLRSPTSFLALAASSLASLMASSVSPASVTMSAETMVLLLAGSGAAIPSALLTSSPAASTTCSASLTLSCSSAFSSASLFSFSSRAVRLSASRARSRAMPTAALRRWKFSHLTPLSPSSTSTLNMASTAAFGTTKSNSDLAYLSASRRSRNPSLLASYLVKRAWISESFLRASAFLTALSLASLQVTSVVSVPRVHSLILCNSLASACFVSEAGCPGSSAVFISCPLDKMKSVQIFIFSFASTPASSTALAVAVTSSILSSLVVSAKGSASSFKVAAAASASFTSVSSSLSSASARSCASFRLFSISARCSLMFVIRCVACFRPCSDSIIILSRMVPQASISSLRVWSSSVFSSSMFSGVAI
mmetsp:Transcript_109528/g.309596  ORF Transcript_109528/g.309596 Transcript_109528/m.309596 type:complete len:682 (-) Transcript_109528:616-2661(-)